MISLRLLATALRRYGADPEGRESAVRVMLLNALRLGVHHLGARETAKIALMALPSNQPERDRACS